MFYEERVGSLADLKRRLRVLDQDAGVRLDVGSGKNRSLTFMTRFGQKYTAMTYSVDRSGVPRKMLKTVEYEDFGRLEAALGEVKGPFRAWVY